MLYFIIMFTIWTCCNLIIHFPFDGNKFFFSYCKQLLGHIGDTLPGAFIYWVYIQGVQVIGCLTFPVLQDNIKMVVKMIGHFFINKVSISALFLFIPHPHMIFLLYSIYRRKCIKISTAFNQWPPGNHL